MKTSNFAPPSRVVSLSLVTRISTLSSHQLRKTNNPYPPTMTISTVLWKSPSLNSIFKVGFQNSLHDRVFLQSFLVTRICTQISQLDKYCRWNFFFFFLFGWLLVPPPPPLKAAKKIYSRPWVPSKHPSTGWFWTGWFWRFQKNRLKRYPPRCPL